MQSSGYTRVAAAEIGCMIVTVTEQNLLHKALIKDTIYVHYQTFVIVGRWMTAMNACSAIQQTEG
jgi:hypothetical protein